MVAGCMFISCDRRPAGEFTLSSELTGARRTWLLGLLVLLQLERQADQSVTEEHREPGDRPDNRRSA
jgi:hypothetical protein